MFNSIIGITVGIIKNGAAGAARELGKTTKTVQHAAALPLTASLINDYKLNYHNITK